mmetsp:Transcript_1983/g.6470  ORF Transcript_1983/g.6470 Transcript_1983/m.6470 type:complete len:333 (-) Transcript_1983:46-1044(-)
MGAAASIRSNARSSRRNNSASSTSPSGEFESDDDDDNASSSTVSTSSARLARTISSFNIAFSSTLNSLSFSGAMDPFASSPLIAINISYPIIPTACDRFKLVGPVPPVYFKLLRHNFPAPAVGMATAACAHARSSFVSPVRSLPNKIATFPRLASSATRSAASRAVINGVPLRGRAVVANTKVQSFSASSLVLHRSASRNNQSAAHAYRMLSSESGVSCAASPRISLARSGAVPSPSDASSSVCRPSPAPVAAAGFCNTNGPTSTSLRSYTPKFCMLRAHAPTFAGPWGFTRTKRTFASPGRSFWTSSTHGVALLLHRTRRVRVGAGARGAM